MFENHEGSRQAIMIRKLVFLCLVASTFATLGFDTISTLSVSKFQCMKNAGYTFFIGRVYRSSGSVDTAGMQMMTQAWQGGMSHVDGYIFPCFTCSTSPAQQVTDTVNALKSNNIKYGMLWLDVEIYKWSSSLTTNQQFIESMAAQLDKLGVSWGIYSNYNNWSNIVGVNYNKFSNKPLWWPTYNNQANLNNFKAFGGWTKPNIHQYSGDVAGPCGFNTDLNVE